MDIAQYIDHTLLKPESTAGQIKVLCDEAREHNFKSVCVNPSWISNCKEHLKGSDVLVCTVIGFPLGATLSEAKAQEATIALNAGADEFDMVINNGFVKSQDFIAVKNDISAVRKATEGKVLKVILETCLLTDEEIKKVCEICVEVGADFVKTSTGFSTGGATVEAVKIMLETVQDKALVKASGGVRSPEDAKKYLDMGVKRLGTSSGVKLVAGETSNSSY